MYIDVLQCLFQTFKVLYSFNIALCSPTCHVKLQKVLLRAGTWSTTKYFHRLGTTAVLALPISTWLHCWLEELISTRLCLSMLRYNSLNNTWLTLSLFLGVMGTVVVPWYDG